MVKAILNGIFRGFSTTIGRIIAYILIGLLIGYIAMKIDTSNINVKELIMSVRCGGFIYGGF